MSFRIFLKYKYTQKYKDFTGLSKIIIFADPDGTTFCGMKHGNVKIEKTNAARLLDRAKIAYELIPIGEQPPRMYPVVGSNSRTGIRSAFLLPEMRPVCSTEPKSPTN